MKQVITTEELPIKLWLGDIEEGALKQAKNLANLPFAFHHIAIMPDAHLGYGMPIGGVLATADVVIPNAVGVDIGCGMCAVKTSLTEISVPDIKKIMSAIRKTVPVGFDRHDNAQRGMPSRQDKTDLIVVSREYPKAQKQVGTLGGGNHFIEIQKGSDGFVWIMVHSGSRNLGKQVADYYNKLAVAANERSADTLPKAWELAYLRLDSDAGQSYLAEMNYCVDFALANREAMLSSILDAFKETLAPFTTENKINIAHNYAAMETHFGRDVIVHRKGATQAKAGQIGIIPGSQGSRSYIVKGLGNADSFNSCSHGAGRKMGRKQAQRTLSLEAEIKKLDDQGVIHAIRGVKDLDEAAGAYKDIDMVMENQRDLVEIIVELTPLAVVKG